MKLPRFIAALAVFALVAALSFVGMPDSQDDELSCGSVGRLVATAEAYALETGDGFALVNIRETEGGASVALNVRVGKRESRSAAQSETVRYRTLPHGYNGDDLNVVVCDALTGMMDFFTANEVAVVLDEDRARSVQGEYEGLRNQGTSISVSLQTWVTSDERPSSKVRSWWHSSVW